LRSSEVGIHIAQEIRHRSIRYCTRSIYIDSMEADPTNSLSAKVQTKRLTVMIYKPHALSTHRSYLCICSILQEHTRRDEEVRLTSSLLKCCHLERVYTCLHYTGGFRLCSSVHVALFSFFLPVGPTPTVLRGLSGAGARGAQDQTRLADHERVQKGREPAGRSRQRAGWAGRPRACSHAARYDGRPDRSGV
jgi:hypothetical protein